MYQSDKWKEGIWPFFPVIFTSRKPAPYRGVKGTKSFLDNNQYHSFTFWHSVFRRHPEPWLVLDIWSKTFNPDEQSFKSDHLHCGPPSQPFPQLRCTVPVGCCPRASAETWSDLKGDSPVGRVEMPHASGQYESKADRRGSWRRREERRFEQVKREGHGTRSRNKSCETGHIECW